VSSQNKQHGPEKTLDSPIEKKFTAPETDLDFTTFPNGRTFAEFKAMLILGKGEPWTEMQQAEYEKYKQMPVDKIQWALMNLDTGRMISQSTPSKTRIFGASTSKMFVVSALLEKQNGEVRSYPPIVKEFRDRKGRIVRKESASDDDLDHMARIYMRSNNHSWVLLQQRIGMNEKGELNADRGRVGGIEFTEKFGYFDSRAWQGDLMLDPQSVSISRITHTTHLRKRFNVMDYDYIHGNELTAADTVKYLYDTYSARYPGAEYAWKLLYTCQTGEKKGNKYIPNTIFVGGKTGTYPGGIGSFGMTEVNGVKKAVGIHNHALTFHYNGTQYGIVVLTDVGTPEAVAVITGGLIREFLGINDSLNIQMTE
jgi:hypothetical protein